MMPGWDEQPRACAGGNGADWGDADETWTQWAGSRRRCGAGGVLAAAAGCSGWRPGAGAGSHVVRPGAGGPDAGARHPSGGAHPGRGLAHLRAGLRPQRGGRRGGRGGRRRLAAGRLAGPPGRRGLRAAAARRRHGDRGHGERLASTRSTRRPARCLWRTHVGTPVPLVGAAVRQHRPARHHRHAGLRRRAAGLVYAVAETTGYHHVLVGDRSVTDGRPSQVRARQPDRRTGQPRYDQQRPALTLQGGRVYVAFGGLDGRLRRRTRARSSAHRLTGSGPIISLGRPDAARGRPSGHPAGRSPARTAPSTSAWATARQSPAPASTAATR